MEIKEKKKETADVMIWDHSESWGELFILLFLVELFILSFLVEVIIYLRN